MKERPVNPGGAQFGPLASALEYLVHIGQMLAKNRAYLAQLARAGMLVVRVPIVPTSHADSLRARITFGAVAPLHADARHRRVATAA
jgi:hypothetical protein